MPALASSMKIGSVSFQGQENDFGPGLRANELNRNFGERIVNEPTFRSGDYRFDTLYTLPA
eukprot:16318831-Heterocapsa_arctica.AAC.1